MVDGRKAGPGKTKVGERVRGGATARAAIPSHATRESSASKAVRRDYKPVVCAQRANAALTIASRSTADSAMAQAPVPS
jgi:hypothetical protein